jgi:hypothetical protein
MAALRRDGSIDAMNSRNTFYKASPRHTKEIPWKKWCAYHKTMMDAHK